MWSNSIHRRRDWPCNLHITLIRLTHWAVQHVAICNQCGAVYEWHDTVCTDCYKRGPSLLLDMLDGKDKRTSEIRRRNETLQISFFFSLLLFVLGWCAGAWLVRAKCPNRGQTPSRPRWKSRYLNASHVRWLTTRPVASLRDTTLVKYIKFCFEVGYGSGRDMKEKAGCGSGYSGCGDVIMWRPDIFHRPDFW